MRRRRDRPPPDAEGAEQPRVSLPSQPARAVWASDDPVIVSVDGSFDGSLAGWGFTVANQSLDFLLDFCGPVVVDACQPLFIGARVLSNNTGELSALILALRWVRFHVLPHHLVVVEYDSDYAANTTRGSFRARANTSLVIAARSALYGISSQIQWRKVKSHTGLFLNDRADSLANCGAGGITRGVSGPPPWAAGAD